MSEIIPSIRAETGGTFGLTGVECRAITEETYQLITQGFACGVGEYEEDGITYAYVLDFRSHSFTIGRHAGVYFLVDPDEGLLAVNRLLDRIVDVLKNKLVADHSAGGKIPERRRGRGRR